MIEDYPFPVSQLLKLGDPDIGETDYPGLGLTHEHVPELTRLVQDEEFRNLPWDREEGPPPDVYAPIHAWRALAELGAAEAVPALIGLLHYIDDDDDDYVAEDLPLALGLLGAAALEPARDYLADRSKGLYARVSAGHALAEIARQHPDLRDASIQALVSTLKDYDSDDQDVNAFTLTYLGELKAVEAAPLAEEIFKAGRAELMIAGDYEDFQIAVGLLEERVTPPDYGADPVLERLQAIALHPPAPKQAREKEKKEKNKRKQAKKARKRQHKKK